MNKKFIEDYETMTQKEYGGGVILRLFKHRHLRYIFVGRLCESKRRPLKLMYEMIKKHYENRYGLEMDFQNIMGGLQLMHAYNITVNSRACLGHHVTLFKGVTIGSVRSGKREGVPVIGDSVVICTNATVVGNIKIGNDVLIAANSMVDFDVPDHSLVLGNPGIIKYKENAAKDYLTGL